ncbi:MAG: anti-anti-sigma factor [Candidatus Marinimicrobia bacterium]|nr:anti-anti-sigma factor [Candidatus Neomarinimicrobiota bacterium]|tara:strand:+ start:3581 stop:3925 length:345 start_codon:yes stop_codon:yes gene_type:complete
MEIIKTQEDSINILQPIGRIDSNTASDLENSLLNLLENEENKIVINLDSVDYISSAGLRIFLMAGKKLKSLKGSLVLTHMNVHIKEVFDISGFTPIFNIARDNVSAVKKINGDD